MLTRARESYREGSGRLGRVRKIKEGYKRLKNAIRRARLRAREGY